MQLFLKESHFPSLMSVTLREGENSRSLELFRGSWGFYGAQELTIWFTSKRCHDELSNSHVPFWAISAVRGIPMRFQAISSQEPQTTQEDINGEKRTVKKWWIFGADFFSRFGADFFTVYANFSRFIKGYKR